MLQPLSETLCWIILPIVFKSATASTSAKYRQTYSDVISWSTSKIIPVSDFSLWVVALSLVIYWFLAAEHALFAFLPALTPLLLLSHNYLLWHDTNIHTASSPWGSRFFSFLSDTTWGSISAALFATLTLKSDLRVGPSDALSIIAVTFLLIAYLTLDPKPRISNRSYRILPPFDIEDAVLPLALRVTLVLVITLGIETLAFGFPVVSTHTPALALIKAVSWYYTIQTVGASPRDSCVILILIKIVGSTLVLAHCRGHGNIQHRCHS